MPATRISIFFATHMSRPLTRDQLRRQLEPLGAEWVRLGERNLRALFRRHPGLQVVSVREWLAGADDLVRGLARRRLQSAGLLRPQAAAASGPRMPALSWHYGGPFPDLLPAARTSRLFGHMRDMQVAGAALLAEGLAVSASHIVISAWEAGAMAITASDTDKRNLHLYSQTPLVVRKRSWTYFGDPAFKPSSEAASHWQLHRALARTPKFRRSCLLHFHHAGLRDAARAGDCLALGDRVIPCITPRRYGSTAQGQAMADALERHGCWAVTVAEHGTWFVAKTLPAALDLAREAVRCFSLTLSQSR